VYPFSERGAEKGTTGKRPYTEVMESIKKEIAPWTR